MNIIPNAQNDVETGDVVFQDPRIEPSRTAESKNSKLIRWIMDHSAGKLQDEKHAEMIVGIIAGILFLIGVMLMFGGEPEAPTSGAVPPDQVVPN